jgi:hypothetical protein
VQLAATPESVALAAALRDNVVAQTAAHAQLSALFAPTSSHSRLEGGFAAWRGAMEGLPAAFRVICEALLMGDGSGYGDDGGDFGGRRGGGVGGGGGAGRLAVTRHGARVELLATGARPIVAGVGSPRQQLHRDLRHAGRGLSIMFYVTDASAESATLLLPGTHCAEGYPAAPRPGAAPRALSTASPAGTLLLFCTSLGHCGQAVRDALQLRVFCYVLEVGGGAAHAAPRAMAAADYERLGYSTEEAPSDKSFGSDVLEYDHNEL